MADETAQPEPIPVEPLPVEPIPVEPLPVEAIPVEPVPVESIPAEPAIPALPANFYLPPLPRPGPPRLVKAMGVWSIVVASLGLLVGPIAALVMAGSFAVKTSPSIGGKPRPLVALPPQAEVLGPSGYGSADRAAACDGLSRLQRLTPGQQAQLDELLAESGRDVLPLGSPIDPAVVAAAVSQSGQLGSFGNFRNEPPPTYFAMANGRLELTEGRAVFFPNDGQPTIRAVAFALPPLAADATAPPLADDAIRSTLRTIVRYNGSAPKSAQVQALTTLLRGPSQQMVVPTTDGTDPAAEVADASSDADGTLTVNTVHGTTTCETTVSPTGALTADLGTTSPAVMGPPPGSTALGFTMIIAGVEWMLAIYLLVIGILTVRRSTAGRLLHWIYVGVKLPAAALAIAAGIALGRAIATGAQAAWWASPAIAGAIYPAALVVVLLTRPVRDYYRTGGLTSGGTRSAPW